MASETATKRLESLLEASPTGNATGRSLDLAIAEASGRVRESLFRAGVLEQRAIVTQRPADIDSYTSALVRVDAAYAELWALLAYGKTLIIDEPETQASRLQTTIETASASLANAIASGDVAGAEAAVRSRVDAHRQLRRIRNAPMFESGLSIPPVKEIEATSTPSSSSPEAGQAAAKKAKARRIRKKLGGRV